MALAELIGKLRTKRQVAAKTAFSHYLQDAVKPLASGEEADADEVGHILEAAGKTEDEFERDLDMQQKRIATHATMLANQQAAGDRLSAEAELQRAQQALQAAYDKLQPAVDQAHDRLKDANHRFLTTMQAEQWLADPANILDAELLEREKAVSSQLRAINQELKPLQQDHVRKQTYLQNLESHLGQLRGHAAIPWLPLPFLGLQRTTEDISSLEFRIAGVRDEVQQLNAAIRQRQSTQVRLQAELAEIHRQKLLP